MMPLSDVQDQVYQDIDSEAYSEIEAQYSRTSTEYFEVWEALIIAASLGPTPTQVGRSILTFPLRHQIEEDIQ